MWQSTDPCEQRGNVCARGVPLLFMFLFLSGASCEIAAGGNDDAPVQAANDRQEKAHSSRLWPMLVVGNLGHQYRQLQIIRKREHCRTRSNALITDPSKVKTGACPFTRVLHMHSERQIRSFVRLGLGMKLVGMSVGCCSHMKIGR